jgi:peroxisomal membrane protein 2
MFRSRAFLRFVPQTRAASQSLSQVAQRRSFASPPASSKTQASSFSFFSWYSRQIDAYPLLVKCVSAGLVAAVGDVCSQMILKGGENSKNPNATLVERVEWDRTARFVFMNVFMVGPTLHYWYRWLGIRFPGTGMGSVAKRVFVDEFIFTPLYYPVFLTLLWKLEHGEKLSFTKIGSMLWAEMPTLILAEWIIYVPAQSLNFRYVPGKFQVLFSNVVGIVWNGYLSWTADKASAKNKDVEGADPVKEDSDSVVANLGANSDNKEQPVVTLLSRKTTETPAPDAVPATNS